MDQASALQWEGRLAKAFHRLVAARLAVVVEAPLVGDGNGAKHVSQSIEAPARGTERREAIDPGGRIRG